VTGGRRRGAGARPGAGHAALADFAQSYADQTVTDHAALGAAIAAGVVQAAPGV